MDREAFEKLCRCRCRYRKPAVGRFDIAAPQGEWRDVYRLNLQVIETDGGADNIDNGIDGTNLVKVHMADLHAMHLRLCFSNSAKDTLRLVLYRRSKGAFIDHGSYVCIMAMGLILLNPHFKMTGGDPLSPDRFHSQFVGGGRQAQPGKLPA